MKREQSNDYIVGDKILGNKITLGDVQGTAVAIENYLRLLLPKGLTLGLYVDGF